MSQKLLVTGGAGYIGSHTVRQLVAGGHQVVVLDNLVYGHQDAIVDDAVTLVIGEIENEALVETLFAEHQFDAVLHFAAYAYVGESVTDPGKYYRNNTAAPLVLLEAMRRHDCKRFIFSSTCGTYGNPEYMPLDEKHPQRADQPLRNEQVDAGTHPPGLRSRLWHFATCACATSTPVALRATEKSGKTTTPRPT